MRWDTSIVGKVVCYVTRLNNKASARAVSNSKKVDTSVVDTDGLAKRYPFMESGLWFARCLVAVIVGMILISVEAAIFIPTVGNVFIVGAGLNAQSTMIEIMSMWLVPQLFIAGLMCVATVYLLRGLWRKLTAFCETLLIRRDGFAQKKTNGKRVRRRRLEKTSK